MWIGIQHLEFESIFRFASIIVFSILICSSSSQLVFLKVDYRVDYSSYKKFKLQKKFTIYVYLKNPVLCTEHYSLLLSVK